MSAQAAALAKRQGGFLAEYQAITSTESGAPCLVLPPDLPFEKYREVVALLGRISGSVPFYVGDANLHGEASYGEAYAQAMNDYGLAYQTLANYTHTCRWVEADVRRGDLSFGHHAAVANFTKEVGGQRVPDKEKQRYWLDMAADKQWSRAQMREAIAAQLAPGTGNDPKNDAEAEQARRDAEELAAKERAAAEAGANGADAERVRLSAEQWLHVLRDVYNGAVPASMVQGQQGYYAVPDDVMAEVAAMLGEEWQPMAVDEPGDFTPPPPPVIEHAQTPQQVPPQVPPSNDDDITMAPPAQPPLPPSPGPPPVEQPRSDMGEVFELD